MAYSSTTYIVGVNATVGQTIFDLTFTGPDNGYLEREHVYMYINDVETGGAGGVDNDGFTWLTDTQVELKTYSPVEDDEIVFKRIMAKDENWAEFTGGSIDPDQLNNLQVALLYVIHELMDRVTELEA